MKVRPSFYSDKDFHDHEFIAQLVGTCNTVVKEHGKDTPMGKASLRLKSAMIRNHNRINGQYVPVCAQWKLHPTEWISLIASLPGRTRMSLIEGAEEWSQETIIFRRY